MNIYLNNWKKVPAFLYHKKINLFISDRELGDLGDVGKFFMVEKQKGYIFTVDDKILYPSDYVLQMVNTIELAGRKAAVSCHGRNFHNRASKSYYYDILDFFPCLLTQPLTFVHEVGTGVLAFHSDLCTPTLEWFPFSNMTDIYFSLEMQKRSIPMLIHPHKKRWLQISTKHDDNYSIHASLNNCDGFQTDQINSIKWKINKCPIGALQSIISKT